MVELYLKYYLLIIGGFYVYSKLLNLKRPVKSIAADFAFAVMLSALLYCFKLYLPFLIILVMIVISLVYITFMTKTRLELSITTTILSFGIGYAFYTVSALLASVMLKLFNIVYSEDKVGVFFIIVAVIQLLLIRIPFKFRRFKSGMPFLRGKGASNTGVFISVLLLCGVMLISNNKNADLIYVVPAVAILLCGVFILFWWRRRLTKAYQERLRTDEIRGLQAAIQEKNEQIKKLEQHNDALAKIIHKDNKLIPAMELIVREYLQSFEREDNSHIREKGRMLLKQLEAMVRERSGIIGEYQSDNKKLPSTNVLPVDALMTYMFNKARKNEIEFELMISGSVKYLTENIISAPDLNTLLADLTENAIISAKNTANKKVLVSIGISDSCYVIDIFDSGIPFEIDTLVHLGLEKITTHADSGGQGIGLTTAFEILKTYCASFLIEEFFSENSLYTKKVSVIFDELNQYTIKTARSNAVKSLSQREDLIVIATP